MIDFKDNLGYKICCARLEIKDNLESLKRRQKRDGSNNHEHAQ